MRPIDIARQLNVSTSILRHYEKDNLLPAPGRKNSGYRAYEEIHLDYFKAIRSLSLAHGYVSTKQIMRTLLTKGIAESLWLLQAKQQELSARKESIQNNKALPSQNESYLTIGQVAKKLNLSEKVIRHWCLENIIKPKQDKNTGYRLFDGEDLKQISLIQGIRATHYSLAEVKIITVKINAVSQTSQASLLNTRFKRLTKIYSSN